MALSKDVRKNNCDQKDNEDVDRNQALSLLGLLALISCIFPSDSMHDK